MPQAQPRSVLQSLSATVVLQVLKTLLHGDRAYFGRSPELLGAAVFLHLSSHVQVGGSQLSSVLLESLPTAVECNTHFHVQVGIVGASATTSYA
jgi:hypothetical protein